MAHDNGLDGLDVQGRLDEVADDDSYLRAKIRRKLLRLTSKHTPYLPPSTSLAS